MHGGSLLVRHGIDTTIGQHIHINIAVLQQEGVIACLLNALQSLLYGQQVQFLYNAHLVHLQGHLILGLIKFYGHNVSVLYGYYMYIINEVVQRSIINRRTTNGCKIREKL